MNTKVKQKQEITREKVDFSGFTINCGIDVHKKNWNVSVYLEDQHIKTFQQPSDENALLAHLRTNYPNAKYRACYEAGFCGFSVYRALESLGIECFVANACDIPQTNKGTLSKTDSSDSRRIGESFAKGLLRPIHIPKPEDESDRNIIRYRRRLQKDLKAKKQYIKSTLNIWGIKIPAEHDKPYWTNNFIKWIENMGGNNSYSDKVLQLCIADVKMLRQRMLDTNKLIKQMAYSDKYKEVYEILTSTPGIGLITAMTIITEIQNIKRFDSFNKFNSYIGLCPSEFSSGEVVRKGKMTVRCHKEIRRLIIESAWIAIKIDPALTMKFNELIKTKTKKRAIVVIAKKLLSRIYSIWYNNIKYEKGIIK